MPLNLHDAAVAAADRPSARGRASYEAYFGFGRPPFSLTPDPTFLFWSASHDAANGELLRALQRGDGFIVFTGDIGTGKTTICRAVLERLDGYTFTALVLNPIVTEEELLKTILQDFGVLSRDDIRQGRVAEASRQDLIDALNDFLLSVMRLHGRAVVFIDDAQNLPMPALEQLRVLSNLETNTSKLLQIVLIGQTELESMLQAPQVRPLNQRVSIRCKLQPLTRAEVRAYIDHRLGVAQNTGQVTFAPRAVKLIHRFSHGVPRVINLLCDNALQHAAEMHTARVTPHFILRAAEAIGVQPVRTGPLRWFHDRWARWF